jgi:hypothetical protein
MQTNKEALQEILMGASFGFVMVGVLILFTITSGRPNDKARSEDRFKVVDQYGPCEVVRYAPKNGGNYAYFLDCK